MRRLAAPFVVFTMLAGCLHSPIGIVPSTKPLAQDGYDVLKPVQASDCLWLLLGLIPVSAGNRLHDALQEAIDDGGGDALIQVTSESFYHHYIVVARSCVQVNGIAVRSKGATLRPPAPAR